MFAPAHDVGAYVGAIMAFNKINRTAVGADDAIEHSDPGFHMGHSTVTLNPFVALRINSTKHLATQRDRPFAALRVTVEGPISSSVLFFETASSGCFVHPFTEPSPGATKGSRSVFH